MIKGRGSDPSIGYGASGHKSGSGVIVGGLTLLLLLVIHLAPVALGANRPLPWFYNAAFAGLIVAGLAISNLAASSRRDDEWRAIVSLALPLVLLGAVAVWAIVQIVPASGPLPAHPVWAFAGQAAGELWTGRLSVDPVAGALAIIRLATAVCVFLAVFLVCRTRRIARLFLAVFAWVAIAYAVYGIARLMLPADKVLWFDATSHGVPAGPFLNRNNAATYFGLGALAALGVIWLRQQKFPNATGGRRAFINLVGRISGGNGVWITVFVVLASCVLLTGSRAGSIAFATSLGAFFLFVHRACRASDTEKNRGFARAVAGFGTTAGALAMAFGLALLAGGTVGERIAELGLEPDGRMFVYGPTLAAVSDNLYTGSGLGTFEDIFPHYRAGADAARQVWDKAHNDYVELFLGLGLPMALVALAVVFVLVRLLHHGLKVRRRDQAYCAVALSACVLVGVHAVVDFSLQIQAVALSFAMLLAIGVAQSAPTPKTRNG